MQIAIEPMVPDDWPQVRRIYLEGIATGNATFTTDVPSWEEWDKNHLQQCRLAARDGEHVLGWAALSAVSSRCVYTGVAEVSIYIGSDARGKGVGKKLLSALAGESERHHIWTLQAGVFPENSASIAMHAACGFRQVGRREKLGKMQEVWRDILLLERRSKIAGC